MTSETSHTALVSLGRAKSKIVAQRRERLVEGRANERLLHVDRLDLPERPLRRVQRPVPTELREVAGPAHSRRRRREECLRTEDVAERLLVLRTDLPDEKRVRIHLSAELRQRGCDVRRS